VDKRGVSRQIQNDAIRSDLRDVMEDGTLPEGMGYIVRTAAGDQKKQDVQKDLTFLLRLWKRILTQYKKAEAPAPLYREGDMVIRTVRDYFTTEIGELVVDNEKTYERLGAFFRAVMPWHGKKLKLYDGRSPLFSKHNIEAQIASIHEEKVKLPSGGSIVIQQTEALVSVDVNSGAGAKNKDIEQTALATNLEAAAEIARQLRLRDMGGLIVLDFIDMRSSANRNAVRKELQKALKHDKARTDVGTISKFGLLELSRQRLRSASAPRLSSDCPMCGGTGKLRSTESFALTVLRTIQAVLAKGKGVRTVRAGVGVEASAFLMNRKRRQVEELEQLFGVSIEIYAETHVAPNSYYIEFLGGEKTRVETNLPSDFATEYLLCRKGLPVSDFTPAPGGVSYELLSEPEGEQPEEPDIETEEEAPEAVREPRRGRPRRERHTREPAEESAAPATAPSSAPSQEQPQNGEKKRRRRRRRKKRGGEGAGLAPQGQVAVTTEETPPASPVEAAPEVSVAGQAPEQSGEAKPSRGRRRSRRRRRGKGSSAASPQQPQQEGAQQAPAASEPAPQVFAPAPVAAPSSAIENSAPEGGSPVAKPKQKRAPRKPKKAVEAREEAAPAPAVEAEAPAKKPARRRSPSTRAKRPAKKAAPGGDES
jgi:ribonuclease E